MVTSLNRLGIGVTLLSMLPFLTAGQSRNEPAGADLPLRIEIPVQSDKETYRIIPCGAAGMVLFYKSVEVASDHSTRWYFSYYDRNLERIWVKSAPILSYMDFKEALPGQDTLYFYFEADKKNLNQEINFQILRVILNSGSFILNNGKTASLGYMASFDVIGQKAFIGLNNEEANPSILIMDLPTGQPSVIPLASGEPSAILHGTVDPENLEMDLLVSRQISKRSEGLFYMRFRPDGTELVNSRITGFDAGRSFSQVTDVPTSSKEILIAGTYTTSSGKKSKHNESTGLFSAPVIATFHGQVSFFNFLDMKNIRQLLGDKDILDLRKKSMKKSRSDQEYSLDFSLLLHDMVAVDDLYILAGEAYYAQYHTESFTEYDFYGRPFTNSYSVFDGYRFTGILLAAFTKEGKMVWDNAMSIRNVLSFYLEPKVTVYPAGDEIVLTYLSEGKIACRIIRGPETVEKTTYSEVELTSPNDKLVAEPRSRMVHWYDHYFLCSGYQEIRDISKGSGDERMVFFCNKVRFDR